MYVYTGTLSYLDYARNELFILIFPRSFTSGDPALAFWHWTVSGSGKRNQPTSLLGRIDSVTPSPSSDTTTVRLFQTSFYRLTLLLPHPHPHPSTTLLMTFSNQDDSSSADAQVLNLRYVDNDALDLCRVYVGTLSYFEYALSTPIVFVLPRGKWEKGEKIGVYWQWTVDAAGTRKVVSNNQGSVDWSVEEGGGERRVGFLGELYYSFVGEVRGEGEEGERMSFTMWNRSRTDKGSVLGRLLYAGAKLELPAPLMSTSFTPASSFSSTSASTPTPASIPASTATLTSPSTSTSTLASTSTFPSTSTSTSTSASISTHPLSPIEPFHLTTTFHPHSVTHPSPTHPPSLSHPSTPQHSQAGTWTDTRPIGSGGFGVVTLQTCSDRGGQLRAVKKLPLGMRGIDYHRELRSLATLSDRADIFINFLGWYSNTDFVYIAMEYLHHGDLAEYIQTNPVGAHTNARALTMQLLRGLDILHKRKICHRDLKPPNVLLVTLDPIRVKITDFGISKQMAGTQLRTRCGTSGYVAPEIMGFIPRPGGDYTDAVDMWALGTILHELFVGVIPFAEQEEEEEEEEEEEYETMVSESAVHVMQVDSYMLHRYCSGLIPFPEELLVQRGVGSEARELVRGLLAPQPERRWGVERALASMWLVGGSGSG